MTTLKYVHRPLPFRVFPLLCLLLFPFKTYSQTAVDLTNAWEMALENNLSLQQIEKTINRADIEISRQKALYYPSFKAGAGYMHQSEVAQIDLPFLTQSIDAGVNDQYDLNLAARQVVFSGFRRSYAVDLARSTLDYEQNKRQVMSNLLLLDIGRIFYNIRLNKLQYDVLEQSIAQTENQLTRIRDLLRANQAIGFDTLEVANRKLQLRTQQTRLLDRREILLSGLRFLLNSAQVTDIRSDPLDESFNLPALFDLKQTALANRPEIQQNRATREITLSREGISQAGYYPNVIAQAAFHYARPGVNFFKDEWMDYYVLGVNLQWDLWSGNRNRMEVQQIRLDLAQTDLRTEQIRNRINSEVEEAYFNLQSSMNQYTAQKQFTELESERYRITNERYLQGLSTALDLRSAENSLTEARLKLQQDHVSWHQFKLQLDYAIGLIGRRN